MKSTVLYDQTWHSPMYFEDERTGEIVLLTTHYRIRRTPKGHVHLDQKRGSETFRDTAEMVDALERSGWKELPAEADGNSSYVPPEVEVFYRGATLAAPEVMSLMSRHPKEVRA